MAETGRGDENGKDPKDQKRGWVEKLRRLIRPVVYLSHNWISRIGVVLTTTSAITLIIAYASQILGYSFNPIHGHYHFPDSARDFCPGAAHYSRSASTGSSASGGAWGFFPLNTLWFHFRARNFAARQCLC